MSVFSRPAIPDLWCNIDIQLRFSPKISQEIGKSQVEINLHLYINCSGYWTNVDEIFFPTDFTE